MVAWRGDVVFDTRFYSFFVAEEKSRCRWKSLSERVVVDICERSQMEVKTFTLPDKAAAPRRQELIVERSHEGAT